MCNQIWDLFEDHHLFDGRGPDNLHSNEHLLAEMVAILGPPPVSFLQKCAKSKIFWDESGILLFPNPSSSLLV